MKQPKSPHDPKPQDAITQIARGYMGSRILFAGYELGVFTVIDDGPKTSDEIAKEVGANARAIDRLLNSLVVLGLLVKETGKFKNAPDTSEFLVRGKPEYMSNLQHISYVADSWSTLTEAVRQGKSVYERPGGAEGEKRTAAFIEAMDYLSKRRAEGLISHLDLTGVKRVLDIGGGSGENAMEFARAKNDIEAVVFDLPKVVGLTDGYIENGGLSDRVKTVPGDYHEDEFGEDFDMVLLSQIIHSNSPDENEALIAKCVSALNDGGRLVIQDFIVDDDRTDPPWAVTFALNMLVGTGGGDTYTEGEVRGFMQNARLSEIERIDTDFGTTLIIGTKE